MSGKRLLEAAALYQAARGVVSKHVALRSHQFEAFKKTSSLAKAVIPQTSKITPVTPAASALSSRLKGDQVPANNPRKETSQIPSTESVQTPESTFVTKQGLRQDHFYERSEQNSTAQPQPDHELRVQQESAKRYPLPDGTIPSAESKLPSLAQVPDISSQFARTEPVKNSLSETTEQSDETLEPSSDQSSIAGLSKKARLPSPENARLLQRQAEQQIPSQAAEAPAAQASDVDVAKTDQRETMNPEINQNQDIFYTSSPKVGQVLSALPRVKLPKNAVDEQHSLESVPDGHMNPDTFNSRRPTKQEQNNLEKQAIPQQDEPSDDTYSELFHSPKVAKILNAQPKSADSSRDLDLKSAKETPIQNDGLTSVEDSKTLNTRVTGDAQGEGTKNPGSEVYSPLSKSSQDDNIEALAADIAKDTSQETGNVSH